MSSDIITQFIAGDGDIASARALGQADEADLSALVTTLEGDKMRAHLEALGHAGLPKAIKKAARKAAYRLKSAGVSGEARPTKSLDLTEVVSLERIALLGPPGLDGHTWLVLSQLDASPGGEIDCRHEETKPKLQIGDEVTRGQLKRFVANNRAGRATLAHADLAVRFLDRLEAELSARPGGLPPSFAPFATWRTLAQRHGADGARADARAHLAADGALEAPDDAVLTRLFGVQEIGLLVPTEQCLDEFSEQVGPMMHADAEITREAFEAGVEDAVVAATDAWFGRDGGRIPGWLEADADVLFARGDREGAAALLHMADAARAHEGAGSALAFAVRAVREVVDIEHAWQHRLDHIAGHAHH